MERDAACRSALLSPCSSPCSSPCAAEQSMRHRTQRGSAQGLMARSGSGRTSFMEVLKLEVSSVPSSRALKALAKNHAARSTELQPGSETKPRPLFFVDLGLVAAVARPLAHQGSPVLCPERDGARAPPHPRAGRRRWRELGDPFARFGRGRGRRYSHFAVVLITLRCRSAPECITACAQ